VKHQYFALGPVDGIVHLVYVGGVSITQGGGEFVPVMLFHANAIINFMPMLAGVSLLCILVVMYMIILKIGIRCPSIYRLKLN
jgi:hypothetical protein